MTDEELMKFSAVNECLRVERESDGDLLISSPKGFSQGRRSAAISAELGKWAEKYGEAAFGADLGINLPDGSMRNPTAAWIEENHWRGLCGTNEDGFLPFAPYFVIELCSPSDSLPGLQAKMEMWIANGVQVGWLVDPFRKVVTIYRPDRMPEEHEGHTSVFGEGLMGSFELPLARIWA